jgi:hypothetical protein
MVSEQAAAAGWAAQFEAACHLVHFHHLQDLQVAMEARPRRLIVLILAPETEIKCIAIRCIAKYDKYDVYDKYDKYDKYDQYDIMTNMTNMTI